MERQQAKEAIGYQILIKGARRVGKQINHNFILYFNTMDRDGILKQLGEQKSAIYCQYEEKAEEVTGEIRHCKRKGRWFVVAQLSTFLLAVISIAIYAT